MTVDDLIAHLTRLRDLHGGQTEAMIFELYGNGHPIERVFHQSDQYGAAIMLRNDRLARLLDQAQDC